MIRKENYTQLGMHFQKLNDDQKLNNPQLFEVCVNYKKLAQDVAVDLTEVDPLYNERTESEFEFFEPIIIKTAWMPQEAYYDKDRAIGISIMSSWPDGSPKPMPLEPWVSDYYRFRREMKKRYEGNGSVSANIFREWDSFISETMATIPNVLPCKPSDQITDYIEKFGSSFNMPLGSHIYGSNPTGFTNLSRYHESSKCYRNVSSTFEASQTDFEPLVSTLDTAFTNQYTGKASW